VITLLQVETILKGTMTTPEASNWRWHAASPTVDQLFDLRYMLRETAVAEGAIRRPRQFTAAEFLMLRALEGYGVMECGGQPYYWTRRFTARIGEKKQHQQWSMRVVESFWVQNEKTGENDGYRMSYRFRWSSKKVGMADKKIHVSGAVVKDFDGIKTSLAKPKTTGSGIILPNKEGRLTYIERANTGWLNYMGIETHASDAAYEPAVKLAKRSISRVSYGDIERLQRDVEEFSVASRIIHFRRDGMLLRSELDLVPSTIPHYENVS